jgi:hypothetical protein
MDGIETLALAGWSGPFAPDLQQRATVALETGRVVFCPTLPFMLDEAERALVAGIGANGLHKNISFDPATGRCKGTDAEGEKAAALAAVMRRFADAADGLLRALLPRYAAALERARTSLRPAEIEGRERSWREDDRRLHIDAFPSRPMRGRRILRVFSNIDLSGGVRRWLVGEPFETHAARFLPRLRPPLPGAAAMLALVGATRGRRSRYDYLMLRLHDASKRDAGYQAEGPRQVVDFPAGSTWIVYTDMVPHAAISGCGAFEQTFHLDPAAMADPARAPVHVLERLTGRALV